jgi:lysylphosphatidylglycerol synthetase-like protein (DUF2156 family)
MHAARATQDDPVTLVAVGCIAALVSAAGHEALGHGASCLAVGGQITLLTTTHFKCLNGSPLVDAAGPAMNLILAALGAVGFRFAGRWPALRLFFLALAVFNTFWFAGEALRSSLSPLDDEAALARTLDWPPAWRPICFITALVLYWLGVASFVEPLREEAPVQALASPSRAAILLAGGCAALALAGLCWRKDPIGGAIEGLLSVGAASAPILLSARAAARRGPVGQTVVIRASALWVGLALTALILFSLTQGRGFGRLS